MKLKIDTQDKTVIAEEIITLGELTAELKRIFPKDYLDYKLIFSMPSELIYAPWLPSTYPETNPIINPPVTYMTNAKT